MNADPERLLSAHGGLDPQERELLTSLQQAGPPAGAKDEAWRGVAAQLALGASLSLAAAAAAPTTAAAKGGIAALLGGALTGKVVVGTVAAVAVVYGGYVASQRAFVPAAAAPVRNVDGHSHASSAKAAKPDKQLAPPLLAAETAPVLAAEPPPQQQQPDKPSSKHVRPATRIDRLRIESTRLSEARAQLRAGHAALAAQILTRLQAEQPDGALLQEREILGIDVLLAQGNHLEAQRRARAFVAAHPNSPHATKLGRVLAVP